MDEQQTIPRPNYLPALAAVGVVIAFQNLAIRSDTTPDPFLRPALSVTQAFRLPPEMQPARPDPEGWGEGLDEALGEEAFGLEAADFEEGDPSFDDSWEEPPELSDEEVEDPVAVAIRGAEEAPEVAAAEPEAEAASEEAPEEAPEPPAPAPAPEHPLHYKVKTGDTLYGIARRFEMNLSKLLFLNPQIPDGKSLRPGMRLAVKTPKVLQHKVASGESLWSISRLYGITVGQLIAANSLASPAIRVNQVLEVPTEGFSSEQFELALRRVKYRGEKFMMPVHGRKTDHFGMRRHPILGRMIRHRGLDIAARKGSVIRAAQDGVVTFSGWLRGYGNLLEIRHADGYTTRYGHCDKLLKEKGSRVARGDVVARIGETGLATAPHLHFEIRRRGVPEDPMKYL